VIAGDDEPYYRYKRKRFLRLLNTVDFQDKKVMELGSGPGGNLIEVWNHKPQSLTGADISNQMVQLAKKKLPSEVNIVKIDGTSLPFDDKSFDTVFTATVLQHNTDEDMLFSIMKELCRVSADRVFIFERIEKTIMGDDLCCGRPIAYYADFMKKQGFKLKSTQFINIRMSYYISGAIRKGLNPKTREEGQSMNKLSTVLQQITLPITSLLDKVFTSKKDLGKLEFERI
jgi:ubiquinone/menaquinone biosynthesis C-methylase UbiE